MAHDVFISHSSKDKTVADATCAYLESRGIRCWVAPRDIQPGATWGESIVNAIRGSRVMILIFSHHANASPQIKREVERAVNAGVAVIPMRIEDVAPQGDLEYFLGMPHWLDAYNAPLENYLDALADAVNNILALPAPAPKPEAPVDPPEPASDLEKEIGPEPVPSAERKPQPGLAPRTDRRPVAPPSARTKKSRAGWIAGLLLFLVIAAGLGYYFGIYQPTARPGAGFTAGNGMKMVWVVALQCWVGKYPVTQEEYEKVTGKNPSEFKGPSNPVETVSWDNAMAYCAKLTQSDRAKGILPPGYKYSLPTDEQYSIFVGDASLDDAVTGQGSTMPVGSKGANEYGLYDTRGNVCEWCLDWYDDAIKAKDTSPSDTGGGHAYRVVRGASWLTDHAADMAVGYRTDFTPDYRYDTIGFRCVAVVDAP